jgi:hypothetical protein
MRTVPIQSRPNPDPRAQNVGSYSTTPQYVNVVHGYISASSLSQNHTRGQAQQIPQVQTQTTQRFGQTAPFNYKQRSGHGIANKAQDLSQTGWPKKCPILAGWPSKCPKELIVQMSGFEPKDVEQRDQRPSVS